MTTGRPTVYTEELDKTICSRIASGESVRHISLDDEMPNASTIHAWVLDNDMFSKHYARAKSIGIEIEADLIEEIAKNEKDVQRARLMVDTKKWIMSKKVPKKYGDSIDVTSGNKPIQQVTGMIIKKDNGDTVSNKE